MKQLDYLYFNIYNYCSRRNYYSSNLIVRLQVMYLLTLSAGGWALLIQTLFLRLIKHSWFSSQSTAMSFAVSVHLIIGLAFYRMFIIDNLDEKIFNKYEHSWNSDPNKRRDLMISILVSVAPYILLLSLSLLFPRQR